MASQSILSHFRRPKVTLKTIAKVNKLDAGTPSCTQPPKPFSIVSMQYSQQLEIGRPVDSRCE